jgi:formylglycine-generating enzyme required for sulfatase activity
VFRGGSWDNTSATIVRAAFRIGDTPSVRGGDIGFRCAQRGVRQPLKVQP